jgi:hypothetical protein
VIAQRHLAMALPLSGILLSTSRDPPPLVDMNEMYDL